jgi:LysM repeat protein
MASVAEGTFQLESADPPYLFVADFDDLAPLPTDDSYGGWSIVPIPRRMGLTEWAGRNPLGLSIDFMIDRHLDGTVGAGLYVREMRDTLDKLAATHSRDSEPPPVTLDSNGLIPHDRTHAPWVLWVIEALTWDKDATIINTARNPTRVSGTVTLRQYNTDEILDAYKGPASSHKDKTKGDAKNKGSKPAASGNTYTVKAGDTLTGIAAKTLGKASRWREIADLNNIRDPRGITAGQKLKLPKK